MFNLRFDEIIHWSISHFFGNFVQQRHFINDCDRVENCPSRRFMKLGVNHLWRKQSIFQLSFGKNCCYQAYNQLHK